MDDLISRQAAIDAMEQAKEQYFDRRVIIGKMQDVVNNLPSAQPDIIRCKDCKHYNGEDRDICCPLADYAQSKCGADWFCADGKLDMCKEEMITDEEGGRL